MNDFLKTSLSLKVISKIYIEAIDALPVTEINDPKQRGFLNITEFKIIV